MAAAEPPMLQGALDLLRFGLAPVVLRGRGEVYEKAGRRVVASGKEPRYPAFGSRAVLADEAGLRADYAAFPGSGVGVLLGMLPPLRGENPNWGRPGVIDLEIDDPEAARKTMSRIFPMGIPDTLRFESSGAGRWHYLFKIDESIARRLLGIGITKAVLKGLHRTKDGGTSGDPNYAGVELRLGNLRTSPGNAASETQSVVPPTPRADGSRREWVGEETWPFPPELLADLAEHSAAAKAHADALDRKNTPREPLDRGTLRGMAPIGKIKAQCGALGLRLEPGGDGTTFSARCTNPDHPDRKPSLSISVVGSDQMRRRADGSFKRVLAGTVLMHCHSRGCTIREILGGLGLWPCDLEPDPWYRVHGPRAATGSRHRSIDPYEVPSDIDPARLLQFGEIHERSTEALAQRPEKLAELSELLGTSEEALEDLRVAWKEKNWVPDPANGEWRDDGPAWLFPMVDGRGRIINLQRRFEDESLSKRTMKGGRLGLFVPEGWAERPGPLYCVEGASDTATLRDLGLNAVGRPSNLAGADHLCRLLRGNAREVVVVGENDRKADAWPGDPRPFAAKLAGRLNRPIKWIVPPAPHKDARAWRAAGADDVVRAAIEALAQRAEVVVPGEMDRAGPKLTGGTPRGGFTAALHLKIRTKAEEGEAR